MTIEVCGHGYEGGHCPTCAHDARVAKLVEALEAIEQGPPLTIKGAQEIARVTLDAILAPGGGEGE